MLNNDLEINGTFNCELFDEKTGIELEIQNEMEIKLPNIEFSGQLKCNIGDKGKLKKKADF